MEFKTPSPENIKITQMEGMAKVPVYLADVPKSETIKASIEFLSSLFTQEKIQSNAILIISYGQIEVWATKDKTAATLFEEYTESYERREQYWKEQTTERDRTEFNNTWQAIERANKVAFLLNKNDELFGFKLLISNGNPEVLKILDKIQDFAGDEKAEEMFKKMESQNVEPETILEVYNENSASNTAEFIEKVENNSPEIFAETKSVDFENSSVAGDLLSNDILKGLTEENSSDLAKGLTEDKPLANDFIEGFREEMEKSPMPKPASPFQGADEGMGGM